MVTKCIQETYAPHNACFGCGPANQKGLHVRSFEKTGEAVTTLVAEWKSEPHHEAFPGVLNGGIIGALLDCHSNWTAAVHLMKSSGGVTPPCTVTADFHVVLKRPTPTKGVIELKAWVKSSSSDRAFIEATLATGGKVCATCTGTFVAVSEGHPAFHRW